MAARDGPPAAEERWEDICAICVEELDGHAVLAEDNRAYCRLRVSCVYACIDTQTCGVCVCVCVCVRERERERESVCVCVCVCVTGKRVCECIYISAAVCA